MTHPAVVEVLDAPQPGEPDSGMLMLRLEDEQVIGIDPRLAEPAHTDEPEAARIARVHRAVDVMSASGEVASPAYEAGVRPGDTAVVVDAFALLPAPASSNLPDGKKTLYKGSDARIVLTHYEGPEQKERRGGGE